MLRSPDLLAADTFIWLNARLIDRHHYAYLFKGGDAEPALDALRPYQNPDGGFGNALEPDDRGRGSQPAHVYSALHMLDELGHCRDPMVMRALDYLASVTSANGGVPVALSTIRDYPRAPWWNVENDEPAGSLLPTAGIVGLLNKNGVEHPWLTSATAFCWQAVSALEDTHPYEVDFCLTFLEHVPDRDRAEREAERVGRLVREQRFVVLDPEHPEEAHIPPGYAPGEVHTPLDYAPRPTSLARRWFSDQEIERHLDALVTAQGDDGGWFFNWRDWNPATTLEWRGLMTIRALTILQSYGRLAD